MEYTSDRTSSVVNISGTSMAGDKGMARRQRAVERGLGVRVQHGQVAHFRPTLGVRLP